MTWVLDDVEARHAEHPDTFEIPPEQIRKNLIGGDLCKLIFLYTAPKGRKAAERMWVKVAGTTSDGNYRGVVTNTALDHGLREELPWGASVDFKPKHVCAVEYVCAVE